MCTLTMQVCLSKAARLTCKAGTVVRTDTSRPSLRQPSWSSGVQCCPRPGNFRCTTCHLCKATCDASPSQAALLRQCDLAGPLRPLHCCAVGYCASTVHTAAQAAVTLQWEDCCPANAAVDLAWGRAATSCYWHHPVGTSAEQYMTMSLLCAYSGRST